ncbi:coiled-coil domain-containing protein 186-like [Anneissia japonica]|uniref:coiled-coil domain-containing protein 186-like n=1 Tax=Anneissia japonica TaxID=1529436 RepID=UPI0014259561|nr:coiled-coil domain-containing protein 186-like [Anneissia japonica]
MAEEEQLGELKDELSRSTLTIDEQLIPESNYEIGNDAAASGDEPVKRNSNSELEWDSTQDYVEPFVSMENLSMPQVDNVFPSASNADDGNRSVTPDSDEENVSPEILDSAEDCQDNNSNGSEEKDLSSDQAANIESAITESLKAGSKVTCDADVHSVNDKDIAQNDEAFNHNDTLEKELNEIQSKPTTENESVKSTLSEDSLKSSEMSEPAVDKLVSDGSSPEDLASDPQPHLESCIEDTSSTSSRILPIIYSDASTENLEHNSERPKDSGAEFLESEANLLNNKIQNTEGITERTNKNVDSIGEMNVKRCEMTNQLNEISKDNTSITLPEEGCLEDIKASENQVVLTSSDATPSPSQYYNDNDAADSLLSELEDLLSSDSSELDLPNGLRKEAIDIQEMAELKRMKVEFEQLRKSCEEKNEEIKRLQECKETSSHHKQGGDDNSTIQQITELETLKENHLLQIKELDAVVEQQKKELQLSKERQLSHDAAAKRTIFQLQQEMTSQITQLKTKCEETVKEKETMVIKYARSENEVMEQQKVRESLEKKLRETAKTLETVTLQLKQLKADRAKLKGKLDTKESELANQQKDVEQLKEEVGSQGIKVKWAQNKLKTELDAHKETKVKLSKTEQRLSEAKEETEQIRRNCQQIIKTYQESEEMKSNSLDVELKKKKVELEVHLQEQTDRDEVYNAKTTELESLKKTYADCMAELDSLQVKTKCLEDERIQNENLMSSLKGIINSQKEENRKLTRQVEEIVSLQELLEDERETIAKLGAEVKTLHSNNMDLNSDLTTMRQKEADLLRFTEKITVKNADLHSENTTLQENVIQINQYTSELTSLKQFHGEESELLRTKVNEKSKAVEQLTIQLEDARDDNKTLKRKHVANMKDITRQLQQARKRLETFENPENGHKDSLSIGSRTSSNGSLDTLPPANSQGVAAPALDADGYRRTESPTQPQDRSGSAGDFPGVNKAMLVDKIIRLQKAMHKKKEKMDFMQDHMNQLVEELQKKSKIIQMYVLREESGALVPVASDINKAKMSRQGGIMASLYKSQQSDPSMNLDLSLEINRKLQAVLEDTLLKNITLKESIETLGNEIARITSHEMDRSRGGRTVKKVK